MSVSVVKVPDKAEEERLRRCIAALLKGLECQHIDRFMEHLSEDNCLALGQMYIQTFKDTVRSQTEKIVEQTSQHYLTESTLAKNIALRERELS